MSRPIRCDACGSDLDPRGAGYVVQAYPPLTADQAEDSPRVPLVFDFCSPGHVVDWLQAAIKAPEAM